MTIAGLLAMAAGCSLLPLLPTRLGVAGYVVPLVALTAGYALFQAANNTAVMADAGADQRGVISGLLNLSRNLGLITGASAMGAVFALASAATHTVTAQPEAVALGMRVTFAVAAALIAIAIGIAVATPVVLRQAHRHQ
jgi:Na+/melibiose symporter-like transporter